MVKIGELKSDCVYGIDYEDFLIVQEMEPVMNGRHYTESVGKNWRRSEK